MELRYFFSVLSKRKWLLLLSMIVAGATTWLIVSMLPKKYKTSTQISTGITSQNSIRVDQDNAFVQEFEIENKFANMIEYMKSRPAINVLTRSLMLHDLKPDTNEVAFHSLNLEKLQVSKQELESYVASLEANQDTINNTTGTLSDQELQNQRTARALEKALGYDYETIYKLLDIKRVTKSDYMSIEYASENPKLSYFIVDRYTNDVLRYFRSKKSNKEDKSVVFYNKDLQAKKDSVESLNNQIYNYSKANNVVALTDQSQSIVAQIKEAEMALTEEKKKLAAYSETADIYKDKQGYYADYIKGEYKTSVFNNEEITSLDNQIQVLLVKYADSGLKDESLKSRIDALKSKRTNVNKSIALNRIEDNNPANQKNQELYLRYVDAVSNKKASSETIKVLESAIAKLQREKGKLVNNNATLKLLFDRLEIAQDEYKNSVEKQSQANANKQASGSEESMSIVEPAMPPLKAENNKAPLLAAFAGLGTGTIATMFIFLLTYMDRSLSSPFQFSKLVGLPLLGSLNNLNPRKVINFDYLFAEEQKPVKENEYFKESLRKIRHDIESSGEKSFLFTSLKDQEGKSFTLAALAYTFSMKNKKVLIIDTNFKNNTLTGLSESPLASFTGDEAVLNSKATKLSIDIELPSVTIVGNKGGQNSPSELLAGVDFKKKIKDLGKNYDYIFLEAASLNKYSDARELVDFVESVVVIFDATTTVKQIDENSIAFLKNLDKKLLGCVLNKADIKALS
jgi:polysaccharide biosynthesis transport protein